MIYLDNAATTPVDQRVIDAMLPYLTEQFGNPGAVYSAGRDAARAVAKAREQVAELINAQPEQIIFTSGGSESNNAVFHNILLKLSPERRRIAVSLVEHDSVRRAAEFLYNRCGVFLDTIGINADGTVSPAAVEREITPETAMASVMFVNNETGAVNPVQEIGELCRERGVLFHTDCVQALGSHKIDVREIGCDFLSMSSHKIHGPKGVGALYIRDPESFQPLIYGGRTQEFGFRGGTENVPGIVGFGEACELCGLDFQNDIEYVTTLKQLFYTELKDALLDAGQFDGIRINGASITSQGKIISLTIDGVDGETLLLLLDSLGVCISTGSACHGHETKSSGVLLAMGFSEEQARSTVRISFSRMNSTDDAIQGARHMASCIIALRDADKSNS